MSAIVFAVLMLFSGNAFAVGQIVGVHHTSLQITGPKDGAAFNGGDPVTITVKTEGFTSVSISVLNESTGQSTSLDVLKPQGQPKEKDSILWSAIWQTKAWKIGHYTLSATGAYKGVAVPTSKKSIRISIHQAINIFKEADFESPKNGEKIKAGTEVRIVVDAQGANRVEMLLLNTATGKTKGLPVMHVQGKRQFSSSWFTDEATPGAYKLTATGYLTDGTKVCEGSVTVTVTK